jgi:hypothetical protein
MELRCGIKVRLRGIEEVSKAYGKVIWLRSCVVCRCNSSRTRAYEGIGMAGMGDMLLCDEFLFDLWHYMLQQACAGYAAQTCRCSVVCFAVEPYSSAAGGPRVCILGGGFGGLYTAVKLESLLWNKGRKPKVRTFMSQHQPWTSAPNDAVAEPYVC